jgi:bacteriorhodopsin
MQKLTFNLAYILLIGASILTGFGTLNTFPNEILPLKYILSIETCVTIIASVAYSYLINSYTTKQNFDLTFYRYLDWFATTPLLLISLIIYLSYVKNKYENNKTIEKKDDTYNIILKDNKILIIILLNLTMLTFGYMGEAKVMNYIVANILGYIPFIAMLYMIWKNYCNESNMYIFIVFSIVWSMYGVVYYFNSNSKNISYNILDIIAKVGVGILIWYQVVQYKLENIDNLKNNIGNDNNIVKKL